MKPSLLHELGFIRQRHGIARNGTSYQQIQPGQIDDDGASGLSAYVIDHFCQLHAHSTPALLSLNIPRNLRGDQPRSADWFLNLQHRERVSNQNIAQEQHLDIFFHRFCNVNPHDLQRKPQVAAV